MIEISQEQYTELCIKADMYGFIVRKLNISIEQLRQYFVEYQQEIKRQIENMVVESDL